MTKPWEKYQTHKHGPWEKYSKKKEHVKAPTNDDYSKLGSFGMGALESGTLGFADEIGGALGTIPDVIQGKDLKTSYQHNRDKIRNEINKAEESHPDYHTAGQLTGAIGSVFIPGMGWLNATKAAKLLGAFGKGTVAGGVIGAGTSDADLTEGQFEKFGKDILKSGFVGGVAGAATNALGNIASQKGIEQLARERAVKAATGGNIAAFRGITNTTHKNAGGISEPKRKINEAGKDVLDEPDLLGWTSKSKDLAVGLENAMKKYGKEIGAVADQIDALVPNAVNAKNIASEIRNYSHSLAKTQGSLKQSLDNVAQIYDDIGRFSFKEANKYKQSHKFTVTDKDALISDADAINKVREIVSKEMEETVKRLSVPQPFELIQQQASDGKIRNLPSNYQEQLDGLLEKYLFNKKKYGTFKELSNATTDRYLKDLSNRYVSPSDYAAGIATSGTSGSMNPAKIPIAITGAGTNKILRERGSAFAAKTLNATAKLTGTISDNLSKVLEYMPEKLGKYADPLLTAASRGPQSLAAANFILQQTQPEYRELVLQPIDGSQNQDELSK